MLCRLVTERSQSPRFVYVPTSALVRVNSPSKTGGGGGGVDGRGEDAVRICSEGVDFFEVHSLGEFEKLCVVLDCISRVSMVVKETTDWFSLFNLLKI